MPVIRIMSWNVHGSSRPDPESVAAVIRSCSPDVVGLQEVRPRQAVSIARALGWPSPLWSLKHLPYGPLWWRAEGLALLTPLPQERGRASTVSEGAHPFTYRRRIAQQLEVRAAGHVLRCWNVHLASDAGGGGERRAQAERLVALERHGREQPREDGLVPLTVVMGDLNDGPDPSVLEVLGTLGLLDAAGTAARRVGREDGFTSPAHAPYQCLDHVVAHRDLVAEETYVPVDDGTIAGLSDHLPVVASLRIPPA